jgi:hypothetical protein
VSRAFRVKGLNALTRRGGKGGGGRGLPTSNIQDPRSHGLSGLLATAHWVGSASRARVRAGARMCARARSPVRAKLEPTAPPLQLGLFIVVTQGVALGWHGPRPLALDGSASQPFFGY